MELTIHNVEKIKLGAIEKLGEDPKNTTHTREIMIESEDGGVFFTTCFGKTKEDLQIEVEETKKI